MRVVRRQDLAFDREVVDVDFWDDETLLLTTRKGDLRQARLGPGLLKTRKILSRRRIYGPVARSLGTFSLALVVPGGAYPRLAVSALADLAVVNTHDLLLVACPQPGAGKPHLVAETWGGYYPEMAFSADATRLLFASSGSVVVFDTRTWRWFDAEKSLDFGAWHPREPRLMVLDAESGRLSWIDLSDLERPVITTAGQLEPVSFSDHAVGLAYDETRERVVVGYRLPDRLEEWTLNPHRRSKVVPLPNRGLNSLEPKPSAGLFFTDGEAGACVWDLETLEPLTDAIRAGSDMKVSPSGRRFVTVGARLEQPRFRKGPIWKFEAVLWDILREEKGGAPADRESGGFR